MTVIFMENCFQILEKNRILVKTESLCRPAPYQQWEKGAFFWYVRFISSYSTNFSPTRNFQLFKFFHFERNSQLFQNLEILGNLKLKQSQLFPAENTCQNLENPKIFGVARSSSCQILSSNPSWKRLSKFGRTVKFWCGGWSSY